MKFSEWLAGHRTRRFEETGFVRFGPPSGDEIELWGRHERNAALERPAAAVDNFNAACDNPRELADAIRAMKEPE